MLWSDDVGIGQKQKHNAFRFVMSRVLLLRGAARKRPLDHIMTDRLPHGSVELHKTHLLDRTEISWPGVKRDTRKRDRSSVVSQGRSLSHDVLAGEVIATCHGDLEPWTECRDKL